MSIREKINESRRLGAGIGIALLILGLGTIAYQVVAEYSAGRGGDLKVYYSDDDGKTYFPDAESRLPPFDHGGKMAVRAHVFQCGSNKIVGYLEQYTPEALRIIMTVKTAAQTAKPGDKPPPELAQMQNAQRGGRQVKRPGEAKWVSISSTEASAMMHVTCPGSNEAAREVVPE